MITVFETNARRALDRKKGVSYSLDVNWKSYTYNVRREFLGVISERNDESFSGRAADGDLQPGSVLGTTVENFGRGEVEVSVLARFHDDRVGDVREGRHAVDPRVQFAAHVGKVIRMERVVGYLDLQCSGAAYVVDCVLRKDKSSGKYFYGFIASIFVKLKN